MDKISSSRRPDLSRSSLDRKDNMPKGESKSEAGSTDSGELVDLGDDENEPEVSRPRDPPKDKPTTNVGTEKSPILKVVTWNENNQITPLATVESPWTLMKDSAGKTLSMLRDVLDDHVSFHFKFCLEDKSSVADNMMIDLYFSHTSHDTVNVASNAEHDQVKSSQGSSLAVTFRRVYISKVAGPKSSFSILKGRFLLKCVHRGVENGASQAIDSSSLQSDDQRILGKIKILVKEIAAQPDIYEFCMEDGTVVSDSTTLATYVSKSPPSEDLRSELPTIKLFYQKASRNSQDMFKKQFLLRFVQQGEANTNEGSMQSSEIPQKDRISLGQLRSYIRNMSSNTSIHEFCFEDGTSASDSMKLQTYMSKCGVPADADSSLPTFTVYFKRLDSQRKSVPLSDEMKKLTEVDIKTDLKFGEGVKDPLKLEEMKKHHVDTSKMGILPETMAKLTSVTDTEFLTPGELDEVQWNTVLRNCNVFYGWKFDINDMTIKRAPHAAFKLRDGLNIPVVPPPVRKISEAQKKPLTTPQTPPTDSSAGKTDPPKQDDTKPKIDLPKKRAAEKAKEVKDNKKKDGEKAEVEVPDDDESKEEDLEPPPAPKWKPNAIPNYVVTDESRVDVSVISSSLQISMARNNFTASSFEAGASGTIKGVELGASGGYSKRNEDSQGASKVKTKMLMVGTYRFPRASLRFRAEDLVPTDELLAMVRLVQKTKSLTTLRTLHDRFGHLFCEEVLIGGSLQTTRTTETMDEYQESKTKSQFKWQIGVAISIPKVFSFTSKYTNEKGSDESKSKQETEVEDAVTFEATGGNTLLCTNPPAWSTTVGKFKHWRVIERGGLRSLVTMIAECHDEEMRMVRQWFAQAIPTFSGFISVPPSRVLNVRLRLMSNMPGIENSRGESYYLAHLQNTAIAPVRPLLAPNGKGLTAEIKSGGVREDGSPRLLLDLTKQYMQQQTKRDEEVSLFTPAKAHGPIIRGYTDSNIGTNLAQLDHDQTVWEVVVPDDEYLRNNGKVMLRLSNTGYESKWLTVYRTAEGTFMPGISSSSDTPFWRLVREKTSTDDAVAEFFSEGDKIRLCWKFSDQVGGFRDFTQDAFGRRRFHKPKEMVTDTLYLKLPFPSFESTDFWGRALVMSRDDTRETYAETIDIRPKPSEVSSKGMTFSFFDTSFRLDLVGNENRGEQDDYLTKTVDTQAKVVVDENEARKAQQNSEYEANRARRYNTAGGLIFGSGFGVLSLGAVAIMDGVSDFL